MPIRAEYKNPAADGIAAMMLGAAQRKREQEQQEFSRLLQLAGLAQDQQQFDARQGLAEQELALGAEEAEARRQLEYDQLAGNLYDRDRARQADLLGDQQRLGAGLAEQGLAGRQRLIESLLNDQAISERQQRQFDQQRQMAALKEALQKGELAYTPEQKTEMERLRGELSKLSTDRTFTPEQREQAEALLRQQYDSIIANPMPVPPDQQPVPLDQQYEQDTITLTDEETGIPIRKQRIVRNGVPTWQTTDDSLEKLKARHKQMAAETAVQQAQLQYERQLEAKRQDQEETRAQGQFTLYSGLAKEKKENRIAALGPPPEIGDFPNTSETAKEGDSQYSKDAYNKALQEYQSKVASIFGEYEREVSALESRFVLGEEPPEESLSAQEMNGAPEVVEIDGVPHVQVNQPEDIAALNLPTGTRIVLPDGRTGTVN